MVCSLGFLNRTGLRHLADIYQDYQSFNEWTSEFLYDPSKHLRAFTVEQLGKRVKKEFMDKMERIERKLDGRGYESDERKKQLGEEFAKLYATYERRLNPEALRKRLEREKAELFKRMTQMKKDNGQMRFRKMAKAYRGQLSEVTSHFSFEKGFFTNKNSIKCASRGGVACRPKQHSKLWKEE